MKPLFDLISNFAESISAIVNVPRGSRLEEYINWRQPQNDSDLERIVRDFHDKQKMW